ncbi:DNA primase [Parasphingorhabdus halotolerans]|uniref:DNA primase n=1 Tax=Parasphingorhabdus halotolerans TaxID=2725558 RepID=A0A6H2DHN2_9SPHN|nr:DNA primase [Parasphingorhabdus halotolerans]QJB68179.1 DNA primase [Parasphingorhabdus halotolerans]
MTLTPQWLEELRSRTTLSTLIGRTVKVTKSGREFKACCPFHNEKTPSFTINDEKGFYHCFGCGAHGDAIRWMTDQRGLGFMDAVKDLASEAQMKVPAPDPQAAKRQETRATLHDVMAAAQDWFVAQFNGIEGAHAREYLKNRSISEKTIRDFGFGFAPDSRGRLKDALSVHGVDQLVEAGLLIKVDDKEAYDRFRGRLMIPIRDPRGRVIAFGGRILGDGEPKYLNSPDTPLFDKGRTLYNLDKASPASRQTGRILVVEGYMDVIALAQAGFEDVVAPLGTALTEHQIERIWKMVEAPILCFDGDNAGQKAAMRAALRALPILKPSHSLKFISLPAGQDPDDLIRSDGAQAFAALINKPQMLSEKIWQVEYDAEPLDTPEAKAGLKKRVSDHVRDIADQDIAQHYRHDFQERYEQAFFARRENNQPNRPYRPSKGGFKSRYVSFTPKDETKSVLVDGYDLRIAKGILGGLIRHPSRISKHFEELMILKLADSQLQALLTELTKCAMGKETLDMQGLLTILEQTDCYNVAKGLLRADALNFTFNRKLPDDAPSDEISILAKRAHQDLAEAIKVVTARPGLEAALAEATRRVQDDLTDESFAEQQRLRQAKQEFHERLVELTQIDDVV